MTPSYWHDEFTELLGKVKWIVSVSDEDARKITLDTLAERYSRQFDVPRVQAVKALREMGVGGKG